MHMILGQTSRASFRFFRNTKPASHLLHWGPVAASKRPPYVLSQSIRSKVACSTARGHSSHFSGLLNFFQRNGFGNTRDMPWTMEPPSVKVRWGWKSKLLFQRC